MHKHGQRKQIENLKLRIVTCVILERNENNEVVFEDSFNKLKIRSLKSILIQDIFHNWTVVIYLDKSVPIYIFDL